MAKKVLIIDDDPEFVDAISNLLDATGYEVVSASNGKEGVAKAETENPDLIIIDVMMETWGEGFNVVDKLHENEKNKDVPRILLTALGLQSPLEPVTPEQMNVRFVLQKPLEPATLLEYVRSALNE